MDHVKSPDRLHDDVANEMSARRTGMSFQRTRMSADRTLMSVIRTSLSLISFGFTIYQLFEKLKAQKMVAKAAAGRNFGSTLVLIGIAMLILGIFYHAQFMKGLRTSMKRDGMIHGDSVFPPSLTLITAVLLLIMGIFAIINMVFRIGPFG
jgi:putative membrane protein